MCCQSDSGFSRRLQFLLMRQFRQRAAHRFLGQARIRVHDFGDRQAGGERLQDERHGNARAAHTRASAQMFRVSDNPILNAVKLWQLRNKSSIRVALIDHIKNFFAHKIKTGFVPGNRIDHHGHWKERPDVGKGGLAAANSGFALHEGEFAFRTGEPAVEQSGFAVTEGDPTAGKSDLAVASSRPAATVGDPACAEGDLAGIEGDLAGIEGDSAAAKGGSAFTKSGPAF
jgi:hypothetical protein